MWDPSRERADIGDAQSLHHFLIPLYLAVPCQSCTDIHSTLPQMRQRIQEVVNPLPRNEMSQEQEVEWTSRMSRFRSMGRRLPTPPGHPVVDDDDPVGVHPDLVG